MTSSRTMGSMVRVGPWHPRFPCVEQQEQDADQQRNARQILNQVEQFGRRLGNDESELGENDHDQRNYDAPEVPPDALRPPTAFSRFPDVTKAMPSVLASHRRCRRVSLSATATIAGPNLTAMMRNAAAINNKSNEVINAFNALSPQ